MTGQELNYKKFDAVVCLSAIDWDFLWQRTHEIMSQFAAMGYPVLFVENTGVRNPGLRDLPRVGNRLAKLLMVKKPSADEQSNESHHNISVLSPFALPFPYSKIAVNVNSHLLQSKLQQFSREVNVPINRILLWSYMTTPLAINLAKSFSWAGVVVDLVSDPCKVAGAESLVGSHQEMLELADIILCASTSTAETAKEYLQKPGYGRLHLFEDGFSTRLYEMAANETEELDLPLYNPNYPVVAYIGGVNDKIWWDAVSAMATDFPEINFVFVGPKAYDKLPCAGAGKNVIWLPPFKRYAQLGSFLKKCSAGLIPYVPTPYVREMRPAKINEYMVMGLPIVATRMPELERLDWQHGLGIVYLAESTNDIVDALKHGLEEDRQELITKRREIVDRRSWEQVCKELEIYLNR